MKNELFPFQKGAVWDLRKKAAWALDAYRRTGTPQILSLQAPTGSGKTIMMASLIESVLCGSSEVPPDEPTGFAEQPEAIFVWLSDSPELNEQSKEKIDLMADRIRYGQTTTIEESSFDQETLDEGRIYFLNTQKLSRTGNLGRRSDRRRWTIWEAFENTAKNKADRLYFVIDEAHRGMQGTEAGRATSIMQRFLKGIHEGGIEMRAMPLVIGMSATAERFNRLAEGLSSTISKTIVTADQVRASGLLKDRIVIGYPEDASRQDDMGILATATKEWMDKCAHWERYCRDQHYRYVDPVFVVQVKAGSGGAVSDTNLEDVVAKIEETAGVRFKEHEVVHTFGGRSALELNGLVVHPVEPSRITEDRRIKVVLFKENLSTGWDCPRAETMMSFRAATDATYIAQLLGRMVRTPLQNRVHVDETLNEVRLYLPYFNADTVQGVIDELKSSECGDIPTLPEGEPIGAVVASPWSIYPRRCTVYEPGQQMFVFEPGATYDATWTAARSGQGETAGEGIVPGPQQQPDPLVPAPTPRPAARPAPYAPVPEQPLLPLEIDRAAIIKAINDLGLLTYVVRGAQINDYLKSLLDLAGLLTRSGIAPNAAGEVERDVLGRIRAHAERLRRDGRYDALAADVSQFRLFVRAYDIFGNQLSGIPSQTQMAFASESDLDRQLRAADAKLCGYGFSNKYGQLYASEEDPSDYKMDVILFAADENNLAEIHEYAKDKFHKLNDENRRYITTRDESCKTEYENIIANGDAVSKHNFRVGETVANADDADGKTYMDHLYVKEDGSAKIRLDTWEDGVIEEEREQRDFVCWLRNRQRAHGALCIPYEMDGTTKPMFPDFLIVRRDPRAESGYVFDILEPHGDHFADNLPKAKGLAKYAQAETRCGRIQMIRKCRLPSGQSRFKRLDFNKGAIRDKVLRAATPEELNNIFDAEGTFL